MFFFTFHQFLFSFPSVFPHFFFVSCWLFSITCFLVSIILVPPTVSIHSFPQFQLFAYPLILLFFIITFLFSFRHNANQVYIMTFKMMLRIYFIIFTIFTAPNVYDVPKADKILDSSLKFSFGVRAVIEKPSDTPG